MFDLNADGQNLVFGLNTSNSRYMQHTSAWDGVTTYTEPCGTAPAGLINPQGVFNWAYHNTQGTVGLWCDANTGIGWATSDQAQGVAFQAQAESNSTAFFVNIPGFGLVRFAGGANPSGWQRIQ
jgi:hypothetical protein